MEAIEVFSTCYGLVYVYSFCFVSVFVSVCVCVCLVCALVFFVANVLLRPYTYLRVVHTYKLISHRSVIVVYYVCY